MISFLPEKHRRFAKFLATGLLNTVFGYGCFSTLLFIGLHYTLAVFIGTVLGVIFNFFTTGALVFNTIDHHRLPRFFAVYVVVYLVNISWLKLMTVAEISLHLGGAIAILPLAALSYFLSRKMVFNDEA